VTQSMRAILVDWLIEVAEEYNLKLRTLELARSYVDRFLKSEAESHRAILQLIGVTCVLLAAYVYCLCSTLIVSKVEEIHPPAVDDLVEITAHTYTREQVVTRVNSCDLGRFSNQKRLCYLPLDLNLPM
jgi:cyclin A